MLVIDWKKLIYAQYMSCAPRMNASFLSEMNKQGWVKSGRCMPTLHLVLKQLSSHQIFHMADFNFYIGIYLISLENNDRWIWDGEMIQITYSV